MYNEEYQCSTEVNYYVWPSIAGKIIIRSYYLNPNSWSGIYYLGIKSSKFSRFSIKGLQIMPVVFFSLPWIQCFGQNFLMDNNVFYFSTSLREDAIILPLFVFSVLRATYFKPPPSFPCSSKPRSGGSLLSHLQ